MSIHRDPALDDREDVFEDRDDAGARLADALLAWRAEAEAPAPVVLAIPAGGVPVAVRVARRTGWPIDVAVVSKITLPWNTEAGYGAVAFDGSVHLNEAMRAELPLDDAQVQEGIDRTRTKVQRRMRRLRGGDGVPDVGGRVAVLVDDGLASGFTMIAAVAAVRAAGAARVVVAAPTGPDDTVARLAAVADDVVCPNVRHGRPFAVAAAYRRWADVPEVIADELLRPFRARRGPWAEPT